MNKGDLHSGSVARLQSWIDRSPIKPSWGMNSEAKALPLPAGGNSITFGGLPPKVISSLALQPTKQPAEQPPKGATQFVLHSTALALQSTVKPSSQPSLRQPLSQEYIQSAPQWSPQPVVHQVVQPPVQPAVKPPPTLVSASFRSGAAVRKDITSQMAQAEEEV